MRAFSIFMGVFWFALFIGCIGFLSSSRAHDFWINDGSYKSPIDGSHCCGDGDCFMIPRDQVKIRPDGYLLTNGEIVPFSEAQPSEDGEYWRCKRHDGSRRCFFRPSDGV